ncbi:MAG: hypothetical protein QM635_02850 [Microbacteriaceae bacterium]
MASTPTATATILDPDGTRAAWAADIAAFPRELPQGVAWPTDPPAGITGAGQGTEVGLTSILLADYWVCAWEEQYIDAVAADDDSASTTALDEVEAYPELPAVIAHFPDVDVWYEDTVEPAKAGDVTSMTKEVASCGLIHD